MWEERSLYIQRFDIRTKERVQFLCITDLVANAVVKAQVESGLCVLFVPHTTAGLTINENADPDVVRDIIMASTKLVPFMDNYRHSEGNSAAHIKSSLFGPSLTLIIDKRQIVLGIWQAIYFCEFDGPRQRSLICKIIADAS